MIPLRIDGATHALGKPEGWDEEQGGRCRTLHVKADREGDQLTCTSAWEPTPEELAALNAGKPVLLRVVGGQPPVMLWVEP